MAEGRFSRRSLLVMAAAAALVLSVPSLALANNINSADQWPGSGGNVSLTVPVDGQQVFSVPLEAGDWFIAYAWTPGTRTAGASIKLYDAAASDVASPSIAASSPNGVLFWQAPVEGLYCVGFGDAKVSVINCGMFKSRPALNATTAHSIVVPYNGGVTLRARLADGFYTYIPDDGPAVGFEPVTLSRSADGLTWQPIYSHATNVNGDISRRITGLTRKSYFVFGYSGAFYDTAAFGEGRSGLVVVTPQVRLTAKVPATAKRATAFAMTGTLQPKPAAGPVIAQARKLGTSKTPKIYEFTVRAGACKSGSRPIRASVKLPTAGTWAVRFYYQGDATYAKTSTPWTRVVVK